MISVVAFCLAGALWLWILVSTMRARDEPRSTRVATYVALGLVVAVVAGGYYVYAR